MLARFDGKPVVARAAHTLASVCGRVFAVLPPGKPELLATLREAGCEPIETEATRLGMGHSIAFGASRIIERCRPSVVVIALGDMPALRPETIANLIAAALAEPESIVAPSFGGRRGHPVVFDAAHLPVLCKLDGDKGAAVVLERHRPRLVAVDDPGVLQDIDTPGDLGIDTSHGSMDRRRDTPDAHQP